MLSEIFNFLLSIPRLLTPQWIARRIDAERWSIDQFVFNTVVSQLKPSDSVLDAGAGSFRYKKALSFTRYEATDFEDIFDKGSKDKLDFVCNLEAIPKKDNTYDAILNTQVLEHVEHPQQVIKELHRVLKPGGRLFLTTNQMWGVHGAPYCFFFYSRYGLASLFKTAGFENISIVPRGGAFWFLAKFLALFPIYIYYQVAFTGFKKSIYEKARIRSRFLAVVLLPLYIIIQLFLTYFICTPLFFLDWLDRQKDFTLGYACIAQKPLR